MHYLFRVLLAKFKKCLPQKGKQRISGRNSSGKITIYHRGGGQKRLYRFIDFSKMIWNIPGLILDLIYDSNRTTALHLILYSNGILVATLAVKNKNLGTTIWANYKYNKKLYMGHAQYFLNCIPGRAIFCIELQIFRIAQLLRTGGSFGRLLIKSKNYCIIRLKPKKFFKSQLLCCGVYGVPLLSIRTIKKFFHARINIYKGRKPVVRGVAKNPVDHPHGGGQGKTSGGRPSVTPWAKITKGKKTRKAFTYDTFCMER